MRERKIHVNTQGGKNIHTEETLQKIRQNTVNDICACNAQNGKDTNS